MARDTVGNTLARSKALQLGATVKEAVGGLDQGDFYRLNLTGSQGLKVALRSSKANAAFDVIQDRNNNGRVDAGEILKRSAARASVTVDLPNTPEGTYFFRIFAKNRIETDYRLTTSPLAVANTTDSSLANSFIERVVSLTNTIRQQFGLSPLIANTKLNTAAQTHSQNMALQDFFSHTGQDGSQAWDRMTTAGYNWARASENIAAGQATPDAVVEAWMNSPGHRANILKSEIKEIGVGHYYLASDTGTVNYQHYWTQVFASPMA